MIARLASALALVMLVATLVALARYEAARDAWRPLAAAQGTSAYDAAASDAAYGAAHEALVWVDRSAKAAAVIAVAGGIAIGRARPRTTRSLDSRARRVGARLVDALTLGAVLATTRITTSSPGATLAIDWLLPALVLALLAAAAANGATVGDRLVGSANE